MNSLFPDPTTQSDQGLIGNLLAQYGAYPPDANAPLSPVEQQMMGMTGPNQPVSGLGPAYAPPPAAVPQPAAPAQPQNDPIAVGNYQMPRIGSGFPDDEDAPTAATPQRAPAAQQPAAPAAPANPLLRIAAGLHSLAQGGSLYGLATGNPDDPRSLQQAELQKQLNTLTSLGVPQNEAKYAVTVGINSEAAKPIIAKYIGADKNKFVQLKDGLGADHPAFINAENQTINGMSLADYNKQNGGNNNSPGLGDMSLTGKDYLNSLPAKQRGTVQAMLEGRQPFPGQYALNKPYTQSLIAAANQVDPSFDATTWPARVKGMTSFRSGADAGTVRSANQVLGHISDLTDKADELHNGDYPTFNYIKNKWDSQTGSDAANNWLTQAHAVADELSAFMKGAGHSSDTEIHQWQESLSPNMSPQQQRGAIKTLMGIYDHALSALEDKRTGAIGSVAAEKLGPLVTTAGQAAMDKVRKWAGNSGATSAVNPSAVEAEMKRRGLL